jgi:aspartate racemase
MTSSEQGRCIGIIGGLGVGATVHYYRALTEAHKRLGRVARLFIAHADVDRVLGTIGKGRLDDVAAYLADFADRLAAAGAEVGAIPAVTPHICIDEIARRTRLPPVSMLTETRREIATRGFSRVALFGTRFTIDSDFFGRLKGIEIVRPWPAEVDLIHDTYVAIALAGRGSEEQEAALRRVANVLRERDGAEAIVLAGTDLALVFNDANTDFPAVDCAKAQIDGIMRLAAG